MNIKITERKFKASERMKEKITKKLSKFDKFFGENADADVLLTQEKERHICEITIHYQNTIFRIEETTKDDMYAAFDESIDSLKRQIRKYKTKLENKFKNINVATEAWDLEEAEPTEEKEFKIVKNKTVIMKPMFVEEAILQMNLLGHQFFVFQNAETNSVDVVYKRKDGNYALIETNQIQ